MNQIKTIAVHWLGGCVTGHSALKFDLIKTDPAVLYIRDGDTGELLYIKPDPNTVEEEA